MKEKDAQRILPLDGLRGIAVLLVLGFHYLNNQYQAMDITKLTMVQKLLMKATYFGWTGVDLFFVLSGFLIGSILLKNRGSQNFFKTFYARRFLRILPVYYLLLFVFMALRFASWYRADAYIFEKEIPMGYYFLFLQNFIMSAAGHFGPEALTPTWSLAIEEQFYLIIPLVIWFVPRQKLGYFILACLCIAPISRLLSVNWYQKYTLLSSRIDSPAIGLLIAWLRSEPDGRFTAWVNGNLGRVKIFAVVLLFFSAGLYATIGPGIFNHTLIALNYATLVVIALHDNQGWLNKLLTARFLVKVGALSYFIYLFHQLLNGSFHLVFLGHLTPKLDGTAAALVSIASLVVVWILAEISYRFFEGPLIRFSHGFKY